MATRLTGFSKMILVFIFMAVVISVGLIIVGSFILDEVKEELILPEDAIGERVVIDNDTLTIVNLGLGTYTLSNGVNIMPEVYQKNKIDER